MGTTSTVRYEGELRTTATHIRSGNSIITDAPVDNQGKGEAFSPTDLVATALASCMLTIMGIKARQMGINVDSASSDITKVMTSGPRKISEIHVTVTMPPGAYTDQQKKILENAARTCPVALSLSEDIRQNIEFVWPAAQ